MTICIAAICNAGQTIVAASDREVGIGFTSLEMDDSKFLNLYEDWHIALAGTVSNATEAIAEARRMKPESLEWFDVMSSVETAYRRIRMSKIEGTILASRGWTLADFQQFGSQRLSPGTYASVDTRMSLYDFEVDFLVCGFGESAPSIITVRNPGVANDHSKLGFWCIGSGSTLAQASLFSRDYSFRWSVQKAAYAVYEAKKVAERASGVGDKETDVFTIRPGNKVVGLPKETKDVLEKIYQELKPRDLTPEQWGQLNEAFARSGA